MTVEISSDTRQEYGDIYGTMQHISDVIETLYMQAGVELPDRQFTAVGDVASSLAWDCEQVTINFVNAYYGNPGQPITVATNCPPMMSADFVVQVTRCVPNPTVARAGTKVKAPAVAAIEGSTLIQAVDSQILLQASSAMSSAQPMLASVAPSGVEGGFQAVALNLSISLFRN
mgnify:CR=1 FL=1